MNREFESKKESSTVEDIMSRNIIFMEVAACTGYDVANKMLEMKVGSIILTHNTRPVGIVTEHDLVKDICATDLLASKTPAESIMSSPFITVDMKISIKIAAKEMSRKNVSHLLVEDSTTHDIIGIATSSDIMNFFRYEKN